jgi:run domain Beclin-1 interacting cysteine-rich containing protein
LLRRFSLVNDSEVQKARTNWIIAEDSNDVPQKLLPMPTSIPISPDQVEEEMVKSTVKLRGTFDWAPPRKQIIFSINTPKSGPKKTQMALQNFRCAGCGQRIEPVYFPRMLFCYYTGKYFCQFGCHRNQKSIIPALILNKWDFRLYPVSTFAFNLIKSMRNEKLFDLQSLQFLHSLQKKSRSLSRIIHLRSQIIPLRQYISSCKRGGNVLLFYLIFEPKDLVDFDCRDLFLFSLDELVRIKTDSRLVDRVLQLVNISVKHISCCSSCRARGFFCEICSATPSKRNIEKDLIFPFEFGRVTSCQICGSCVHTKCLKQSPDHKCLKCERRRIRAISASDLTENRVQLNHSL